MAGAEKPASRAKGRNWVFTAAKLPDSKGTISGHCRLWAIRSKLNRMIDGRVVAVAKDGRHRFSKRPSTEIRLIAGEGVAGDAHHGATVKHRSRVAADPSQPNLRQVHLIQSELFDELRMKGLHVLPADLGENVTTAGLDLLALPRDTLLSIGDEVVLEVTGLRNPCAQIERFRPGLLAAVLERSPEGKLIRKAGIMSIVRSGGVIRLGDRIRAELPKPPYMLLEPV